MDENVSLFNRYADGERIEREQVSPTRSSCLDPILSIPISPEERRHMDGRDVFFSLLHSIRIPVPADAEPEAFAKYVLRIHDGLMLAAEERGIVASASGGGGAGGGAGIIHR